MWESLRWWEETKSLEERLEGFPGEETHEFSSRRCVGTTRWMGEERALQAKGQRVHVSQLCGDDFYQCRPGTFLTSTCCVLFNICSLLCPRLHLPPVTLFSFTLGDGKSCLHFLFGPCSHVLPLAGL